MDRTTKDQFGIALTVDNAGRTGALVGTLLAFVLLGIGFNIRGEAMFDDFAAGSATLAGLIFGSVIGGAIGAFAGICAGWPDFTESENEQDPEDIGVEVVVLSARGPGFWCNDPDCECAKGDDREDRNDQFISGPS